MAVSLVVLETKIDSGCSIYTGWAKNGSL